MKKTILVVMIFFALSTNGKAQGYPAPVTSWKTFMAWNYYIRSSPNTYWSFIPIYNVAVFLKASTGTPFRLQYDKKGNPIYYGEMINAPAGLRTLHYDGSPTDQAEFEAIVGGN